VTDQNQAASAIEDFIERAKGASDPSIVGDTSVRGLGDVEVDADQHLLTRNRQVSDSSFGHLLPPLYARRADPS
jgi:hypothetical protein